MTGGSGGAGGAGGRTTSVLSVLTALTVLTFLTVPPVQAQIRAVVSEDPRVGSRAPGLVLPYVSADGAGAAPFDLVAELGRVVVLVFCPQLAEATCSAAWQEWAGPDGGFGAGVSLVGVSGDQAWVAQEFARASGTGARFLTDQRLVASRRWLAAREGRVAVFVVGPMGEVAYRDLQFFPSDSGAVGRLRGAVTEARGRAAGG